MDKYITGNDSGPTVAFEIEESVFGELETLGMAEEINKYTIDEKKSVAFEYGQGGSVHTSPRIHDGMVYFGACDKNVYALNKNTGKEVWRFSCNDIPFHPAINNGVIYFGCYDGNLYAVEAKTGELKWKFSTNGKIACRPTVNNNKIYFGSQDGNLYSISTNGKLLWKFGTNDQIVATSLVYRNMVMFGCRNGILYSLDSETGEIKWKFKAKNEIGSPTEYNNIIYVPSYDHHLYALGVDGRLLWSYTGNSPNGYKSVCIHNGIIYFGTYDSIVVAINKKGKLLWKYSPQRYIFNTPIVHKGVLYFGSTDANIYAINAKTGRLKWKFKTNGGIISKLTIDNNKIYFGSWDCNFYCIGIDGKLIWKTPTSMSKRSRVDVPEPIGKNMTKFIMKPQDIESKAYKTSVAGQAQIDGTYSLDIGYKSEHEYKAGRKYGK
jgi:outer membrane protein assembly factor BamB